MRMPKPFFRQQTQTWYVQIGRSQINLGPDRDQATEKYHTLMAGKQGPEDDRLSVATLAKPFVTWNQEHRDAGTEIFHSRPPRSLVEQVGERLRVVDMKKRIVENWIGTPGAAFIAFPAGASDDQRPSPVLVRSVDRQSGS